MRKQPFRGYCAAGCGEPVFSKKRGAKFCSLFCSKKRFELRRGQCAHCGGKLKRHQYTYCSLQCQSLRDFAIRVAQLEAGEYPATLSSRFIRRYLILRLGEKCSRCGWAERHPKTGRIPVEIEHIDGDYRNNLPDNLTLLCPNCHSLTDTFRALNRGRGRPLRLGGRQNPLRPGESFKESDSGRPK